MAASSESSSIPRNYGSAQLNFTAFDFNLSNAQTHMHTHTQWQQPHLRSVTPNSETSEGNEGDAETGVELRYTRSNSSSTSTSSSAMSANGPCSARGQASPPSTRAEQDALIEGVIEKLSAYTLTATREERCMRKKIVAPGTPGSGEDAALWMRVWGSAHAAKDARARRRMKDTPRAKPM